MSSGMIDFSIIIMTLDAIINWLLDGDAALQYQVHRDLLGTDKRRLRELIAKEGWGARLLSLRGEDGHWGRGFYQPKWTSTHYTLLDLRQLEISPLQKEIRATVRMIARDRKAPDGGINPSDSYSRGEVCISGMFLNYASYFTTSEESLRSVVDFLLSQHMADGGFNCHSNRSGAVHSSLHTTISAAEGIAGYARSGYSYRLHELQNAGEACRRFMLAHRLFRSDRSGEVIDAKMLMLSYPPRWRYDILRALDYFRFAGAAYDDRLCEALEVLVRKRRPDGRWPLQAKHAGHTHFDMEPAGQASRWNTLRALRVLEYFHRGTV